MIVRSIEPDEITEFCRLGFEEERALKSLGYRLNQKELVLEVRF